MWYVREPLGGGNLVYTGIRAACKGTAGDKELVCKGTAMVLYIKKPLLFCLFFCISGILFYPADAVGRALGAW